MLKQISKFVSTILQKENYICEKEYDIYVYCFEYILENLLYISIILIFSTILANIFIGILFLLLLIPLKTICGGIHASSKFLCLILSYGISMIIISTISFITESFYFLAFPIFIGSDVIIIILSPIDTPNKRLDDVQKKNLKKYCAILLFLFSILFLILYSLKLKLYYGTMAICVMIEAINVLLGYLSNKKDSCYDIKNSSL